MNRIFQRPIILALFAMIVAGASGAALPAKAETLAQALEKYNISTRQRMLSQRMAGLSCLVHLDIEAEIHASEALEARDVFSKSLDILRDGDPDLGTSRENAPRVLVAIDHARDQHIIMASHLAALEEVGTVDTTQLSAIALTSNELFEVSNTLASQVQLAQSQNLQSLTLLQTMILNFSGRQRMLSEKAFKEFCLAQAGVDVEANLVDLAKTSVIFDNTMNALINGMPGLIIEPPTQEIKAKLIEARNVWLPVKDVLERAVAGEVFNTHDIHVATEDLETVRILMDEAVELYEEYNNSQS